MSKYLFFKKGGISSLYSHILIIVTIQRRLNCSCIKTYTRILLSVLQTWSAVFCISTKSVILI